MCPRTEQSGTDLFAHLSAELPHTVGLDRGENMGKILAVMWIYMTAAVAGSVGYILRIYISALRSLSIFAWKTAIFPRTINLSP
jgi:hypothetical protein